MTPLPAAAAGPAQRPSRRTLLAGGLAAAGGALAAPAVAQTLTEWRMVTAWPKGLAGPGVGAQRLADRIGVLTEGKLLVRVFPAGELLPQQDQLQAVGAGQVEMVHNTAAYQLAASPAFAFFSAVPFGLVATELHGWIYAGGGQALWDELTARHGVRTFLAGNTGAHLGGWFRKEIRTPDDFKGLRIRATGLAGQVLARLGALPQVLPGGELAARLRAGDLDAAQFLGPVNDAGLGLEAATSFCYWPGFQDPCLAFQLQINRAKFAALPPAQQAAIEAACAEETTRSLADYAARTPPALAALIQGGGAQLRQFPPEVFQAIGKASGEVMDEIVSAGDDLTRRIAASYFAARAEAMLWTRIGEQGFTNMRLLPYPYPKGA